MSNNISKKILTGTVGASLLGALALSNVVNAQSPFTAHDLGSGYTVADAKGMEGKDSEASCGAKDNAKAKEAKCGEDKAAMKDDMAKDAKPKDMKAKDGKCGEGKCGKK